MSLPVGIERLNLPNWTNRHGNFVQPLRQGSSFKLYNRDLPSRTASYNATTDNFRWLIGNAVAERIRMRALGRGWSFSKVNVCEDGLVDTMDLRLSFNVPESFTHADFRAKGRKAGNLMLTQCGMSVAMLNDRLERAGDPRRSLRASGAAHGQSIVGAFSTNTHGGAFRFGAVHDQIVGLHVVVGADRHVWLERASDPIVDTSFTDRLTGVELLRDDDLFNSALVSFGSFGFIHGVMLEGQPICLLEEHRKIGLPWNARTRELLDTADLEGFADLMPGPIGSNGYTPFHFEVGFNPHQLLPDDTEKGLFLKVMYRTDYRDDYERIPPDPAFEYGDNTFEVLQRALDLLGDRGERLIPGIVNVLYPMAYKEGPKRTGTMSEHFNSTRVRGRAASLALGIEVSYTSRVVDMVLELNRTMPFAGVTALRYVKGSPATLAFTRFPITCVLELDGVDSAGTNAFYRRIVQLLAASDIPFTLHWGKVNHMLDETLLQRMYPQSAIDTWRRARTTLLGADSMEVFNNGFMERCGLDRAQVIV
jgi:hypothetical protein